jgi:hypothetical protein
VLDAAQQDWQRVDFGRRRRPGGGAHRPRVAGDELGVGLVGLGPAEFAPAEGGDLGGVDDADQEALRAAAYNEDAFRANITVFHWTGSYYETLAMDQAR